MIKYCIYYFFILNYMKNNFIKKYMKKVLTFD